MFSGFICCLLALSPTSFFYISAPVAEMRKLPEKSSEVTSEALFSEKIVLLEESGDWVKIKTVIDDYQGWILKSNYCTRQDTFLAKHPQNEVRINRLAAHLYSTNDTVFGPLLTLPFESRLEVIEPQENTQSRWLKVALPDGTQGFIQRGDITFSTSQIAKHDICSFALRFLGLPYTWGGRSSFGYDCSGFVQMLFRQMGIHIPRDSKDQCAWKGFVNTTFQELAPGDLIFWGYSEDKIRHVGMYLGDDKFIHAVASVENRPYIRISKLSDFEWTGCQNGQNYPYRTARKILKNDDKIL